MRTDLKQKRFGTPCGLTGKPVDEVGLLGFGLNGFIAFTGPKLVLTTDSSPDAACFPLTRLSFRPVCLVFEGPGLGGPADLIQAAVQNGRIDEGDIMRKAQAQRLAYVFTIRQEGLLTLCTPSRPSGPRKSQSAFESYEVEP